MNQAIYHWVHGGQPTSSATTLNGFTIDRFGQVFFDGTAVAPDATSLHQGSDGNVERYTTDGRSIIVKRQRETPALTRRLETAGRLQLCGLVNFSAFKTGSFVVTAMEALDGDLHDELMVTRTIRSDEAKLARIKFLWRSTAGAIGKLLKCLTSEPAKHTYTDIKPENIGIKYGDTGNNDQLRIIDIDSIDHNNITYRLPDSSVLLSRGFVGTKLPWYETLNAAMVTLMLVMSATSDEEQEKVYDVMVGEPGRPVETIAPLARRRELATRYQSMVKMERRPDESPTDKFNLNAAEFIFKAGIRSIDKVIEENYKNQPPKNARPRSWDDPYAGGKQQKMLPGV